MKQLVESRALSPEETEKFVSLLTSSQDVLYRYVLTLMSGQHNRAKDVLQEANLVLWRKSSTFKFGTDFEAWSKRIAHFCVLSEIRDRSRKPVLFGEELIEKLVSEYDSEAACVDERNERLKECIKKLPDNHRSMVRKRYYEDLSVSSIAKLNGRSAETVSALLYRIRLALMDCVRRTANS